MSKHDEVIHEAGEFQLSRKELNLDAGMLINGLIDKVFDILNNLDLTHDHKSDIAQVAPYVVKALPIITELAPLINPDGVKAWLLSHGSEFFKDAAAAEAACEKITQLIAEASAKLNVK